MLLEELRIFLKVIIRNLLISDAPTKKMKIPSMMPQVVASLCLLEQAGVMAAEPSSYVNMDTSAVPAATSVVDFAYAPPKWQTAICLPDDPQKSLVDKSGALLYHYGKGGKEFATRVVLEVVGDAVWQKQELHSPRIPLVRTYRTAEGLRIVEEAFAITDPTTNGEPRSDLILVHVTNAAASERTLAPQLIVDTRLGFQLAGQHVIIDGNEEIRSSQKMTGLVGEDKSRWVIQLESLTIAAGKTAGFFVVYSGGGARSATPVSLPQAVSSRDHAIAYWEKAALPYGRIQVPDAGIQALLDSSIRNIWQAREIKNGMTAFQVGPTCYRGLWIVDGAFLLEAATILGAGEQARNGVAYELTHQQPDGRIEVMKDFSKENGIVLWTCARHAQLTQDKVWLESVWPKLQRIAGSIKSLRRQTLNNDSPLDDGLVPPGMPDGGIGGVQLEYTNAYWNLSGMRAFIEAARWLGKADEAAIWQKEYDEFMAAFRKAAARDMRKDPNGNAYLPILMGEVGTKELPQRAQWAFCQAVYPGQVFDKSDPLVAGNLAMLAATEREGMVYGTGWDQNGIWNYFASFYAHACLWQGNGRKAAEALYAFANHAAPMLVWREEQSLKGAKYEEVGDMPHNWASAEFIRLATHLLALDRGNELHLLEGLPAAWTRPGMVTQLNGIATPFGPLTMAFTVTADGKSANLRVEPLAGGSCSKIVVHPGTWGGVEKAAIIELDPKVRQERVIPLAAGL